MTLDMSGSEWICVASSEGEGERKCAKTIERMGEKKILMARASCWIAVEIVGASWRYSLIGRCC